MPDTSCAGGDSSAKLIVYGDAGDLWLYDVKTDSGRPLTYDGDARYESTPAFVTGTCVVSASSGPTTIDLLHLDGGGARRTIVEEMGSIASLDVSPDGTSVLYMHIDFDGDGTYRLKRVAIGGGTPEVIHTFSPNLGRGAGSEDEISVAWSPDGSAILVANTHEYTAQDPRGAIYLFDATGREVQGRWAGTHPRWAPDSRTVYFRGYAGINGQRWHAMDVQTLKATEIGARPGTNNLVVSPDGRRVAYDTSYFGDLPLEARRSGEAPTIFVYDLMTGDETLLRRAALGPLWISARQIVVTNARDRIPRGLNSWESLGTVTRISIGGQTSVVDMTSTLFVTAVYVPS